MKKSIKNLICYLLVLVTILCSAPLHTNAASKRFFNRTIFIQKGKSLKIPTNGVKRSKVKWSLKRSSIASVNKSGKVKANKLGNVNLIGKYKGKTCKGSLYIMNTPADILNDDCTTTNYRVDLEFHNASSKPLYTPANIKVTLDGFGTVNYKASAQKVPAGCEKRIYFFPVNPAPLRNFLENNHSDYSDYSYDNFILKKISFSFKIGRKSYSFRSVCKDVWDPDSQSYEMEFRRYVNGKRVSFGTYSEEKDLSGVSSAEYKKIKNGMSYKRVVNIIGCSGEKFIDMKSHGQHITGYYWSSEDGDKTCSVNFQNGKVYYKKMS